MADQIERKVERRDRRHHAAGNAKREAQSAGSASGAVQRQDFAAETLGFVGRQVYRFRGSGDFEASFGQGLALFGTERMAQFGNSFAHELAASQDLRAVVAAGATHEFRTSTTPASAASTSAASALGTVSMTEPSNGLWTGIVADFSIQRPGSTSACEISGSYHASSR